MYKDFFVELIYLKLDYLVELSNGFRYPGKNEKVTTYYFKSIMINKDRTWKGCNLAGIDKSILEKNREDAAKIGASDYLSLNNSILKITYWQAFNY